MKQGLLWYDAKATLEQRMTRAAARYEQKFGTPPTVAYVPEHELPGGPIALGAVTVRPSKLVLPGNVLIGVEDESCPTPS